MPNRPQPTATELQHVLDAVLDGVVVLGAGGRIEHINAEAGRLLETSAELAPGHTIAELVPAAQPMDALAQQVQQTRRPLVENGISLGRRFGTPLQIDVAVSATSEDTREPASVVVVLRDRTTFHSLREEATQLDQLASYGHIAAGIAHEVKNPLGGIRGAAELLQMRSNDERARRTAQMIVTEVDRISALVEELMVFAKGERLVFADQNLHQLLDEVTLLLEADPLAANVRFDRVYDPSIPEIHADAARLKQVFLNLARNAVQAMGESGGTLTVTTRIALNHKVVGDDGRSIPTVAITFEDDGPGIPHEILDRLATPFFTTRPKGTGLGLAVSRHWVTRHGGRLRIESDEGAGARIRVTLPLDARRAAETSRAQRASTASQESTAPRREQKREKE